MLKLCRFQGWELSLGITETVDEQKGERYKDQRQFRSFTDTSSPQFNINTSYRLNSILHLHISHSESNLAITRLKEKMSSTTFSYKQDLAAGDIPAFVHYAPVEEGKSAARPIGKSVN